MCARALMPKRMSKASCFCKRSSIPIRTEGSAFIEHDPVAWNDRQTGKQDQDKQHLSDKQGAQTLLNSILTSQVYLPGHEAEVTTGVC